MKTNDYSELWEQILKLETKEECEAFFDDLCTINEKDAMLQRIKSAKLLLNGASYTTVQSETGISSATLSRVSRCLQYGPGGYKMVINKK